MSGANVVKGSAGPALEIYNHNVHTQALNSHSSGYGGTGYGHFGVGSEANEGNGAYYSNKPWANSENGSRKEWYSPYQQYSPP